MTQIYKDIISGFVARSEELKWTFKFEGREAVDANRDLIDVFPHPAGTVDSVRGGDTLNLDYTIHVNYLGQICRCLTAILELQKRGICIGVDEEELNHGRCLIRDVFRAIDEINEGVK